MSDACLAHSAGRAAAARVAADWLSLAAAPAFAMMALVTARLGGGMGAVCPGIDHGSLMGGMVPMYVLMGAFHSGPWLRLIAGRRSGAYGC
ncbi:MAG TPA: hypothetical protein VKR62_10840 [Roseiarcus sp.]|nr:hypothetical protein [Roseiarcus sp.]